MKTLFVILALLLASSVFGQDYNPVPPDHCWPNIILPPKLAWGSPGLDGVPSTVSTRYNSWAIYTCVIPTGYRSWWYMFDWAEPAKHLGRAILGTFSKADADADCLVQCKNEWTQAEADFINLKIAAYAAYARVIRSTAEPSVRSVYTKLPNGSRSLTPVANAGVAVGSDCWIINRIATSKYYSVKNDKNTIDGTPLGDVYAECQFVAPRGVNQP